MGYRYKAFISYRHADNKVPGRLWATWLHQAIETYEIPSDLVGTMNEREEEIPARIFPIFRDEEELPADADLGSSITRALDDTDLLIVLCSPQAVESSYVADEIDYFKRLGRSDRLIAAIIDGEPNASLDSSKNIYGYTQSSECFPAPLQYEYNEHGPTETRAEPIAADFRLRNDEKSEEGWTTPEAYAQALKAAGVRGKVVDEKVTAYAKQQHLMFLKIIAGIIGIPLGKLTKRDQEYQLAVEREKARKLRRWLIALASLAAVALGAGLFAWIQREAAIEQQHIAEQQRDRAEELLNQVRENVDFMQFELQDALKNYAPTQEQQKLSTQIIQLVRLLQSHGNFGSSDQRQRSVALLSSANLILQDDQEEFSNALPLYIEATELLDLLVKKEPYNTRYKGDLAIAYDNIGKLQLRLDKFVLADVAFGEAKRLRTELVEQEPDSALFQKELASSFISIGDRYLHGMISYDEGAALVAYKAAKDILQPLVQSNPTVMSYRRQLFIVLTKQGDLLLKRGNLAAAETHLAEAVAHADQLFTLDPRNRPLSANILAVRSKYADLLLKQGKATAAMPLYEEAKELAVQLTKFDPQDKQLQRSLSVSYYKLHDVHLIRDELDYAMLNLTKARDVLRRLEAGSDLMPSDDRVLSRIEAQIIKLEQKLRWQKTHQ